jgi:hypothetical protein
LRSTGVIKEHVLAGKGRKLFANNSAVEWHSSLHDRGRAIPLP